MERTEHAPELGTAEAAVRSLVNLFSRAVNIDEEPLAYWLDCYYQVRARYEQERAGDVRWIFSPEQLKAELREVWQETLNPPKPEKTGPLSPAQEKRQIRERLEKLRANGLTLAEITKAAAGGLNDSEVLSILEGGKVEMKVYRALAAALDSFES